MRNLKTGFTLVEVVIVIVIMGVIASISADLLAKIYQNYIQSRAITRLEIQTEIALDQIAKRLHYRIKPAIIARDGGTIYPLSSTPDKNVELEWLAQSYETQRTGDSKGFGWSGYAFLPSISKTTDGSIKIISHGSHFNEAKKIFKELTGLEDNIGVVFKDDNTDINGYGFQNSVVTTTTPSVISNASFSNNNELLLLNPPANKRVTEFYDLVHTAYKLVVKNKKLYLEYDYKPWLNQRPTKEAIVAENVDSFRFKDENGFIKIKLCLEDPTYKVDNAGTSLLVCKTKAVF